MGTWADSYIPAWKMRLFRKRGKWASPTVEIPGRPPGHTVKGAQNHPFGCLACAATWTFPVTPTQCGPEPLPTVHRQSSLPGLHMCQVPYFPWIRVLLSLILETSNDFRSCEEAQVCQGLRVVTRVCGVFKCPRVFCTWSVDSQGIFHTSHRICMPDSSSLKWSG